MTGAAVRIGEFGPRAGLQDVTDTVATSHDRAWIDAARMRGTTSWPCGDVRLAR